MNKVRMRVLTEKPKDVKKKKKFPKKIHDSRPRRV